MNSPFDKLAKPLGERARAPQFPQRRAPVVKKKGGKIKRKLPGYFFGGMFSGTPASTTTNSQQTTSNSTTDPDYNDLRHVVLQNASRMTQDALGKGLPQYGGPGVVGQNQDQLTAAQNVRNNQGNWQPAFNQAQGDINNSRTFNPFASGNGYVQQAAGMQTGTQAASPFVNQASEQFPDAVQRYMSPYTDSVVNRIADLGARNLNEKLLPGINDTFTGGNAAQFGRERHADIAGRAVRDTQESVLGQQAQALEQGYTTAGNLFTSDANRAAGLAGTTGALANSDIVTHAGLGTTAGNLANQSGNLALNQGAAQQGLGQATQTAAGKDAAALQSVGDAAQQNAQAKETFNYQQWQAQNPFTNPWQAMQAGQSLGSGWQIPSMSNTQGSSTQTQTAAQGSPFGQIMGGLMSGASLAIPGAGGVSALGNIFGSGAAAAGAGTQFAVGGMVPTISQIRKRTMRQPPMQPGMQPAGMPGMPPMAPPNPQMRQPNGQMPSPFARGGVVPRRYDNGGQTAMDVYPGQAPQGAEPTGGDFGDILHGVLGGVAGAVGKFVPGWGMLFKPIAHQLTDAVTGKFDNMDNDLVEDAGDMLPFGIGKHLSPLITGQRDTTVGDTIEGGIDQLSSPMGGISGAIGMGNSGFRRGGNVHPFPHMPRKNVPGDPYYSASDYARGGHVWDRSPNDWKLRRGPVDVRFADGGNVEGSRADSRNIDRQIYDNVLPSSADWHWSKPFYREKINRMIGPPQYDEGGYADSPFLRSSEGWDTRMTPSPEQRRLRRLHAIGESRNRLRDVEQESNADPMAYWRDLLTQVPAGVAEMGSIAGLPGSVANAYGAGLPDWMTSEGIEGGINSLFGEPKGYGGRAGRQAGQVLPALFGVGALRNGAGRVAKTLYHGGNSANISVPLNVNVE